MPDKSYEIIVTRTTSHRFVVPARSGSEAAMKLGSQLSAPPAEWAAKEVELDRRMKQPSIIHAEQAAPATLDLSPIVKSADVMLLEVATDCVAYPVDL